MARSRFRSECYPRQEQRVGIGLGTLLMLVLFAGFISPRTYALTPAIFAIAVIVAGVNRRRPALPAWVLLSGSQRAFLTFGAILLAFFCWSALSAAWSPFPWEGLKASLAGFGVAALVLSAAVYIAIERHPDALRLAEGLWLGMLFSTLFLAIEVWSRSAIKISILNLFSVQPQDLATPGVYIWRKGRIVSDNYSELTRIVAPLPLLLGPAILAARMALVKPWGLIVSLLLFTLVAAAIAGSGSESAKLALVAGSLAAAAAVLSARWTFRGLAALWIVACLFIVPIVFAVDRLDLPKNPIIASAFRYSSPAARIDIWHNYATRTLKTPVFGRGANMTYALNLRVEPSYGAGGPVGKMRPGDSRPHTHNMFLQVWFELGGVGALLFMATGLALLVLIDRLPSVSKPMMLATFAAALAFITPSYGMWQDWIVGLASMVALASVVALKVAHDPPS